MLAEKAGGGRRGTKSIKKMDETELSALVTAEDAYPAEVACPMWEVLRPAAEVLGYTLPNGLTEAACRGVKAAGVASG